MEVFEHDRGRLRLRQVGEEPPPVGEERGAVGNTFQPAAGERLRRLGSRWTWGIGGEEVAPGSVWRRVREVVAVAGEDVRALVGRLVGEGAGERGLADPGLPAEEDQAAVSRQGGGEFFAQYALLPRPADEGGRGTRRGEARVPDEPVQGHGVPRIRTRRRVRRRVRRCGVVDRYYGIESRT